LKIAVTLHVVFLYWTITGPGEMASCSNGANRFA
jgi:hypothetical protein